MICFLYRNFEQLTLSPLFEDYLVPVDIMNSYDKADIVDLTLKFRNKRKIESIYFEAYSKMLHYEEAIEMSSFRPYELKNIQLEKYSKDPSRYRFKIDVSTSQLFYIHTSDGKFCGKIRRSF